MKYAIISVVNGNWKIDVETENLQQARVNYHDRCKTLWNAPDVVTAYVYLVDPTLNKIYSEAVYHNTEPEENTEE